MSGLDGSRSKCTRATRPLAGVTGSAGGTGRIGSRGVFVGPWEQHDCSPDLGMMG